MIDFLNMYRTYFETLYFSATVVLALIALYGLRQIRIMKRDMLIRSERAAKEKALEAICRHNTIFNTLSETYFNDRKKHKIPDYHGPIGDFSPDSIPPELRDDTKKRVELYSWVPALNELDHISLYFLTGVADESVGFDNLGRTYCAIVELYYDIISVYSRDKSQGYFSSIIKLYNIWAPKLTKSALAAAKEQIEMIMSRLPDKRVPIIGQNECK